MSFLVYAFTAGALATLNPCGFALLPAVLGRFLARGKGGVGQGLWLGILLALGTLTAFGGLGLVVTVLGTALARVVPYLNIALALVLLILGALTLAGRRVGLNVRLPAPLGGWKPSPVPLLAPQGRGLSEFYGFGVVYGLASLGCTLPIFLVVAGVALSRGVASGLGALLAYGLGMGVVLTGVSLLVALGKEGLLRALRGAGVYLEPLGGLLLAGAGGYLLGYNLGALTLDYSLGRWVGLAGGMVALLVGLSWRTRVRHYGRQVIQVLIRR